MTNEDDKLMRAARGLATDIAPARDLWPAVAEAISKPRRSRWTPMLAQAAAAVLLVAASSLVTYMLVSDDAGETSGQAMMAAAPQGLIFDRAAFGGEDTLASVYGRAGGNMGSTLQQDLASLSPEAREDVERNLAVIRRAIEDIATALEKEPDNVFLQELLVEAYSNELELMNRIGSMAQRVMARRDI